MRRSLLPLPLAAALLLAGGCGRKDKARLPSDAGTVAALGVRGVKPRAGSAEITRATGELRARNEAMLSLEASGRIDRVRVDVGSRVKKGDVLVELDGSGARIALEQSRAARAAAEAALRSAENDHRRVEELARGDAASAAALERATTGLEQARAAARQAAAAVAGAEDQLAKQALRAPFDGVITQRLKSAGEFVTMTPATAVIGLVDVATVEVRASVPETVVDLLRPGALLDCSVSPSGKPFRARIRTVGAVVEAGTRTVDVRADVVGSRIPELRPGAIVEVALGAGATTEGLFLPADTVQRERDHAFVWTVQADMLRRRAVQVEQLGPGTVRVLSGLGAEDVVVAESGAGLAEGARVRVLQ
jgi:multidrug efflux system membrane fusion protein